MTQHRPDATAAERDTSLSYSLPYVSKRCLIRPVLPDDYDFLFSLALDSPGAWSWGGRPISSESFADSLWDGVLVQHMITSRTGVPLGVTALYRANLFHRFAYFRVFVRRDHHGLGWPLEGVAMSLNYGIIHYDLRKVYVDVSDATSVPFLSLSGGLFREEACFKDHLYENGRYRDLMTWTVDRDGWEDWADSFLALIVPNETGPENLEVSIG